MENPCSRRSFLITSVAAAMTAPAIGAASSAPNILWIMFDDLRADGLGCYGRSWAKTPRLDNVSRSGVRFAATVIQGPICVPSRVSMTTGHYCHTTGVMSMGRPADDPPRYLRASGELMPLLRRWRDAGIQRINIGKCHTHQDEWTRTFDPKPSRVAEARTGARGRQYPAVHLPDHGWQIGGTRNIPVEATWPAVIADEAIVALKSLASSKQSFLLRVSFHEPHVPIFVPPEFMVDPGKVDLPLPSDEELASKPRFEREQLSKYAGTLALTREQIQIARGTYYGVTSLADFHAGRILDCLHKEGLAANTIIAVTSDHGLQLGEHGIHKKRNFYEQTVLVPFLLSWPGQLPEGKVIQEPVEMIDFYPTLMDLCRLPRMTGVPGKSLMPLIGGQAKQWRRATFSEIDHSSSVYDELRKNSGRRVMVRTKEWKLEYFRDERVPFKDGALYSLADDPGETRNLYNQPQMKPVITRLERMVDEWDQRASDRAGK
jgi:choline-sulfatase